MKGGAGRGLELVLRRLNRTSEALKDDGLIWAGPSGDRLNRTSEALKEEKGQGEAQGHTRLNRTSEALKVGTDAD